MESLERSLGTRYSVEQERFFGLIFAGWGRLLGVKHDK
jgi:hypothetical protein